MIYGLIFIQTKNLQLCYIVICKKKKKKKTTIVMIEILNKTKFCLGIFSLFI